MRKLPYVLVCLLALGTLCSTTKETYAQSQAATANLLGNVKDETKAIVSGATVSIKNPETNFERITTTDELGNYKFLAIPPGNYELVIEATGFTKSISKNIVLNVGQSSQLNCSLKLLSNLSEEIIITASPELVETSKTALTQAVDQIPINNLPINGRNFLNFALTNAQISRDNAPPLGPAPTTGLNFAGQRARSNLIQIDGADNIDNTINAARSTISQEAVQEFQIIINSFTAEFGRTAGGVVNIVSKSGTNDFHGNIFGFLRQRSIQARNALAFSTSNSDEKPAFTRGQYGFSLGGPIKKDKTFFFLALDQTRRQESGFSQIGLDPSIFNLTSDQQAYIAANPTAGTLYKTLANSGSQVARTGIDPVTGKPVFYATFLLSQGQLGAIPPTFRVLSKVQNIYPISDKFTFYSAKLDHQLTTNNHLSLRYNYTPATTTGIQSSGQNQPFGLNDISRTGISTIRDTSVVLQDIHTFNSNKINEFLFNFGRRGSSFISSSDVALNITGIGFFGTEPFSPVNRTEKRYEFKDNFTLAKGNHIAKFGVDINYIRIDPFDFQLNFSGQFTFGAFPISALSSMLAGAPALTAVQAYGLGLPNLYVQGFGNTTSKGSNKTFGFYAQDSWKLHRNFTINYGLRYDLELTPLFPTTGITTSKLSLTPQQIEAAQNALGIVQGIPRDKNNFAPRIGIAYDPRGNGKTVIRAAYGIFFDHPLLVLAFNSDVFDGTQSPQFLTIAGSPSPTAPLNAVQIFEGTVKTGLTPGIDAGAQYLANQSRFNPLATFPGYGSLLPFSFPTDRNFVYAYSQQVNFGIEHELRPDLAFSINYTFTGAHKLPHPVDRNTPDAKKVLQVSPTGAPNATLIANNFFRPSGPNPVFIKTNLPIPFGSTAAQESSSSSVYHALNLSLTKRFSHNFQMLVNYSFSKTIDDATDLQTLLQPQNNQNPGLERSRSLLDQRHRFVLSAVFKSPFSENSTGVVKKFLADFTLAPIIEVSSGRPFNILTGADTNLDQNPRTDRPNFDPQTGKFSLPALGQIGNLARNAGTSPGFVSVDMRLARNVPIGERFKIEIIAEAFNLFNRVNVSSVNNSFRQIKVEDGQFKSSTTAAFDPRQFQFALKISF